ncbi:hypothetical protein Rs2_44427 [Raphanus sativus]|nr:hypothetical protein Rs2_44427 [Raphanus sativus]
MCSQNQATAITAYTTFRNDISIQWTHGRSNKPLQAAGSQASQPPNLHQNRKRKNAEQRQRESTTDLTGGGANGTATRRSPELLLVLKVKEAERNYRKERETF